MKNLSIYVHTAESTSLELFNKVASTKRGIDIEYSIDIEYTIDAINARRFDLLIVDLDEEKQTYLKLQKLVEMIYPDAAVTEIDFSSEDFINFKLDLLLDRWREVQDEDNIRFFDLN